MAYMQINNVAVRGLSACVPPTVEENATLPFYTPEEAEKTIKTVGIEHRHVGKMGEHTVSDLCSRAAAKLMDELGWEPESVDLLAFCTQTPDYLNQPCSFLVHEELGLPEECMCVDFYHGCPGWVVSLNSVMGLMSASMQNASLKRGLRRAILMVGDTAGTITPISNHESKPLFGDAGTATALEFDPEAAPAFFGNGTLSADGRALISPVGGSRNPWDRESVDRYLRSHEGTLRPDEDKLSEMDGMDVFSFAISKVPKAMKKMAEEFGVDMQSVDRIVLHQANKFICDTIVKKLKVDRSKALSSLREYGNTTQASIPLSIVVEGGDAYRNGRMLTMGCGFGTGLSYATFIIQTDKIKILPVITL